MNTSRVDIQALHAQVDALDNITNAQWLESFEDRKLKELEFHDRYRGSGLATTLDQGTREQIYGNKKYYSVTRASQEYVRNWILRNAPGKVFLDYACGNGGNAIEAANAGAMLSLGLDISPVSVGNARLASDAQGVSDRCRFFQADAEDTRLPDNCVDVIICSGMLHHLDLSRALPELRRILAPGGRILAVEALNYNPAIKLYRALTPNMRTEWETAHILNLKDVRAAGKYFTIGAIKYWHITAILAPHLRFIPELWFHCLDSMLTKTPLIRLMAWMFTFELVKDERSIVQPKVAHL